MNTPRTALEELDRIADRMDAESSDDMPMQFAGMPSIYADLRKWAKDIRTHGQALSEALGGWLPIESAPKEINPLTKCGPTVLLAEDNWVDTGFYHDGSDCYGHRGQAGWFSSDDWGSDRLLIASNVHPTHWRPLPPPPTSANGAEVSSD